MSSIPANVLDVLVELGGSTVTVVTAGAGVAARGDVLVTRSAAEVGGGVGERRKLDCTMC